MMRARSSSAFSPMKEAAEKDEWEVRPGGMLVQKRSPDSESAVAAAAAPVPAIRVKVKYESAYYEIYVNSQSTFGEVKKVMGERTGVHPQDQKILYKEKERESSAYLDTCGVKDRSKLVMVVDPTAHAKRVLEMRRASKLEKAAASVKAVAAGVDALALQVSEMEAAVSVGNKVADKSMLNLTEELMTQLIKLDGIAADGDIKLQRGMQVRRVQKYVEKLDMLKIKNAKITAATLASQQKQQQQPKPSVVVTTEWEMFDSLFGSSASASASTSTSTSASTTTASSTASSTAAPRSSDLLLF